MMFPRDRAARERFWRVYSWLDRWLAGEAIMGDYKIIPRFFSDAFFGCNTFLVPLFPSCSFVLFFFDSSSTRLL